MLNELPLNPTQSLGLLVFGVATLACLAASGSGAAGATTAKRTWFTLGMVHCLYVLEIWFSTRHILHDLVNSVLRSAGLYADRVGLQMGMLAACGLLTYIGVLAWWQKRPHSDTPQRNAWLAMGWTAVTLLIFLIEMVSLHAIDRLLYVQLGPFLLVAALWAFSASCVVWLAWRSCCSSAPRKTQ
jgi:hypothetical protein